MESEKPLNLQSNEELVMRIVNAQIKIGFSDYDYLLDIEFNVGIRGRLLRKGDDACVGYILQIILDSEPCESVYGSEDVCDQCGEASCWNAESFCEHAKSAGVIKRYIWVQIGIIKKWNSRRLNNFRDALETAVMYLPR